MKPTTRARKCLVIRSYVVLEKATVCGKPNAYIVRFPPVQEVPKVDHDSNTDGHDGKNSIDLGRPSASHEHASGKHPSPPVERKFAVKSSECLQSWIVAPIYSLVTIFAELDIRIDRQRHEENQNRVKQDQSRLSNVGVIWLPLVTRIEHPGTAGRLTEKDYNRRKSSDDSRVSTLLHDIVYNRNRKTTKYGWQGTHSPVRDIVGRVAVTNGRKVKVTLKTDKPSRKCEQQLRKWGVDIEVVLATQIVGCEFAKMDLVETFAMKNLVIRAVKTQKVETYTTWSG